MSFVTVRDVCPRDGLQDISEYVPTPFKIDLIRKLESAGVPSIEATSFVSPKVIPQLADAESVMEGVAAVTKGRAAISGFVATIAGLVRAEAAGLREVATTVPATNSMTQANFRRSRDEMLRGVNQVLSEASPDVAVSVTVAVAFGCPFEGVVPTDSVLHLVEDLVSGGYRTILFGDTVGVANPAQVAKLVTASRERFPEVVFGGHFHDSRGAGIANVVAAVDAGATIIDASVAGLGGCPFAPGAAGNVATEDVVWLLDSLGFTTGVSLEGIVDVARWVKDTLGTPSRSRTPDAVRFEWESASTHLLPGT